MFGKNSPVKLLAFGVFYVGRILIMISDSLSHKWLFRFFVSSCVSFGNLHHLRNLPISSNCKMYLHKPVHKISHYLFNFREICNDKPLFSSNIGEYSWILEYSPLFFLIITALGVYQFHWYFQRTSLGFCSCLHYLFTFCFIDFRSLLFSSFLSCI